MNSLYNSAVPWATNGLPISTGTALILRALYSHEHSNQIRFVALGTVSISSQNGTRDDASLTTGNLLPWMWSTLLVWGIWTIYNEGWKDIVAVGEAFKAYEANEGKGKGLDWTVVRVELLIDEYSTRGGYTVGRKGEVGPAVNRKVSHPKSVRSSCSLMVMHLQGPGDVYAVRGQGDTLRLVAENVQHCFMRGGTS